MLFSASGSELSLRTLERLHNHSGYCRVGVLAVVVNLPARIANIINLKGKIFWFDLISVNIQYLKVHATIFQTCPAIHLQAIVQCASLGLVFQFLMSVTHWILLFRHSPSYPFDIPLLDLRVYRPEHRRKLNRIFSEFHS